MFLLLLLQSTAGCHQRRREDNLIIILTMTKMSRTVHRTVRKSPILLASVKNKNRLEKNKMMRMSVKKLKKIGDPETLLCRAVLINNTLECLRNARNVRPNEMKIETCYDHNKIDTPIHSNYSEEEELILSSIQLPLPITHIREDGYRDDSENVVPVIELSNTSEEKDSIVERLLCTLPKSTNEEMYRKSEGPDNESSVFKHDQKQQNLNSEDKNFSQRFDQKLFPHPSSILDNVCNNIQYLIAV